MPARVASMTAFMLRLPPATHLPDRALADAVAVADLRVVGHLQHRGLFVLAPPRSKSSEARSSGRGVAAVERLHQRRRPCWYRRAGSRPDRMPSRMISFL